MAEYIDRMKVLELGHWHGEHPGFDNPYPSGVDAVDSADIELIPATDVAPVVHGRWIFKFDGPYKRRRGYCSVCGQHSGIGGIQKNQEKPYCPNCGAKMDLEEDN